MLVTKCCIVPVHGEAQVGQMCVSALLEQSELIKLAI